MGHFFTDAAPDLHLEFVTGATDTAKLQALFAAGTPSDLFLQ